MAEVVALITPVRLEAALELQPPTGILLLSMQVTTEQVSVSIPPQASIQLQHNTLLAQWMDTSLALEIARRCLGIPMLPLRPLLQDTTHRMAVLNTLVSSHRPSTTLPPAILSPPKVVMRPILQLAAPLRTSRIHTLPQHPVT